MSSYKAYKNEPIAIVGSSCRFAGGATTPSKLWDLLKDPRDVLSKIDRFDAEHFHHPNGQYHGTSNVRHAYMIEDDVKAFDAQFFNIQAGEAESIDPQQRLLLETIYEGIESAGLTLESLQGSATGVYVGVMCEDYAGIAFHDNESIPKYASTGTARSIQANRISYFFNWCGPSMTIDTACSSSLVAVHQAVQSLRSGESTVAVAAGTNLILGPRNFIAESFLNMLSKDGRSKMWDADANGYARGDGIGSVILKTLSQAIADGDTIECIIRETGVNQDGRTPGITMPSSNAQAALIRSTYAKAGLDLTKKADRCQYFEAHGTGTKAGDPQEASAIYNAFFGNEDMEVDDILHVGSIKTVIGHSEGTAGLAGLIKASLAIQNKTIPPNMLFETLNPDLEPYWKHLKITKQALEWPELPEGAPRRASVNSFGFGGTNAHAIIESYQPEQSETVAQDKSNKVAIPFVFSAVSEKALATQMKTYINFLAENQEVDLNKMAWTLSQRSNFIIRAAVSAITGESLSEKLEALLEAKKSNNTAVGTRAIKDNRSILGIFTGQGAQWAGMGRELILASSFVENLVDELEQSLAELPESDRPAWSLKTEMLAQGKDSRISEGLLSQPLCTAVQVILVNLLRTAGISFEAVVGHSSGEIGAAYAAGFITAHDAIRIAYYRGFYAKLARGANGEKGSMLAAGTSMEDATELCELENFEGKLQVAASNSSSSVTLSGDEDAILEALEILKDEGKFARQLKVDTAYHSHHMIPCSELYIKSLKDCNIQILTPPENAPRWYSSVHGGEQMTEDSEGLDGEYWMMNMLQPVLFSQSLTAALDEATPAVALEVGPHPGLKGPAASTIEEVIGASVPYAGTLSRGGDDVEAFAACLGFFWTVFGPTIPNFAAFSELFSSEKKSVMKSLPKYTWDHDRTYWYESRVSRMHRAQRPAHMHQLLGVRMDDECETEFRWHNFLKPSEIPWLKGHTIQGQILFPAAGFAALAVEASKILAPAEEVALIELHDFSIHSALTFPDEVQGTEIIFTLQNVVKTAEVITANFCCDACTNKDTGSMSSMSSGKLVLRLGEPSMSALPNRATPQYKLRDINVDHQYASFTELGYNYNGAFRAITELQRTTDHAMGKILVPAEDEEVPYSPFTIHPAVLDVGFQVTLCAIGAPGDSRLWTLHVPTIISKIMINPHACPPAGGRGSELPANSILAKQEEGVHGFTGDLSIYDESGDNCIIQCEGIRVEALARPNKASDRHLFGESTWSVAEPDVSLCIKEAAETTAEKQLGELTERACFYYLKQLHQTISTEEREACDEHRQAVLNWAAQLVSLTSEGKHPHLKQEWMNDSEASLKPLLSAADENMEKVIFVGENLIPFIRGEVSMLEQYQNADLLDWFYTASIGIAEYNAALGAVVKQMAHRFPYMNILEIGAGTGSATKAVIKEIGQQYSSYTYTDVSTGFFHEAAELFKEHGSGFVYKVLDAEVDVVEQGFVEGAYDCIVASNVLHATKSLDATLSNARKLLKPGGYLVLLEITQVDWLRTGFFFAGIPGWFAGVEDGRPYTPLVTASTWDAVLKRTGFSGVDTATPAPTTYMGPYSVMVGQAVDAQMSLIRQPLVSVPESPAVENLLIIGGQKQLTNSIVQEVKSLMTPFCGTVSIVEKIEDVNAENFIGKPTVLSLAELDEPVFHPFTEEKFKSLQFLMDTARNVIWVTQGSQGANPYSRMMGGVARCLAGERRDALYMQLIDSEIEEAPEAKLLAETILRMHISEQWKNAAVEYQPLWSMEREMYISKGSVQIERFGVSTILDNSYNSDRREVKNVLPLDTTTVAVTQARDSYQLKEILEMPFQKDAIRKANLVTIKVRRSILTAVKVKSIGCLYLVAGTVTETNQKVFAFCETLQSSVSVPLTWTVACPVPEDQESSLLLAAANGLAAHSILGKATSSSSFLVHESTEVLARALLSIAKEKNIPIAFTTTKTTGSSIYSRIHPSTPQALIASYIPKGVSVFVNFSTASSVSDDLGAAIERELPAVCKRRNGATLFSNEGFTQAGSSDASVAKILSRSIAQALAHVSSLGEVTALALNDLPDLPTTIEELRVVDWTKSATVPVSAELVNKQLQFRPDGTYWMIGATGEIGLSTCQWMINRGAKYFVLTSRNPNVDQAWLDTMESLGATVKIMSMDITSRESMQSVHDTIVKTLPPIVGVTNAAMVLKDSLMANVSYEDFCTTLKPKVDGTVYLNELFPNDTLDFFIVYSSLAYVAGNLGQAPYAAANGFMVALAEQRRKRGLAGSVMSFGAISGVGYVQRRQGDFDISAKMNNLGYAPISEWDYHQFFAEAVLASPPNSGRNFEISNGCKVFDTSKETQLPYWLDLPKFAYYKEVKANAFAEQGDKRQVSVRAQLKECTSEEAVKGVLMDRFISGLCIMLHIAPEDNAITPESGLVELGIDSLVAVDIRSWFQSEMDVDMPVLKILSGASIENMVEVAFGDLPQTLTPNFTREVTEEAKAEEGKTEEKEGSVSGESEILSQASVSDEGTMTPESGSEAES